MNHLLDLLALSSVNVRSVVLGCLLLGGTAGAVGCFALLRRRALLGDALAHAALPGVVLGFVVAGKSPFFLLGGAIVTSWAGALAVHHISHRSKIKEDSSLAIVLSVFFALGVVGLTLVQKSGDASQTGLSTFLFGHAASLVASDVSTLALLAAIVVITLFLFYKEFKLLTFDATFAKAAGLRTGLLDFVLITLLVVCIVIGLQTVGIVLMAAMLITPAAAARFWTDRLSRMLVVSVAIGSASGIAGAYASYAAPNMPTGPWMVVAATMCFFLSLAFAPLHGLVPRALEFRALRTRWREEHVLKVLYALGETTQNFELPHTIGEIQQARPHEAHMIPRCLDMLRQRGLVRSAQPGEFNLTPEGRITAAAVVRRHRLWELYLAKNLGLPPDHVHRDAESIEHVMTPEFESQLEAELGHPKADPHGSPIPPQS